MNFNELLQERRKMLASYEPKSEEANDPPSKEKLPEWMRTRASIFKKSTDTMSETNASTTDQVKLKGIQSVKNSSIWAA